MTSELIPFNIIPTSRMASLPNLSTSNGQKELIKQELMRLRAMAGNQLGQSYSRIRKIVYETPGVTSGQMYEYLGAELSARVQLEAVLIKTLINYLSPGAIVDDVPEATITLPQ